jgi:hypothetical protein
VVPQQDVLGRLDRVDAVEVRGRVVLFLRGEDQFPHAGLWTAASAGSVSAV